MTVQDVMTAKVMTVEENTSFREVAEILITAGVAGYPWWMTTTMCSATISRGRPAREEVGEERYYCGRSGPPLARLVTG